MSYQVVLNHGSSYEKNLEKDSFLHDMTSQNNFVSSSETTTGKKVGVEEQVGLKKVICMQYFVPYLALYGKTQAPSTLSF